MTGDKRGSSTFAGVKTLVEQRERLLTDLDAEIAVKRAELAKLEGARRALLGHHAGSKDPPLPRVGSHARATLVWLNEHPGKHNTEEISKEVGIGKGYARAILQRLLRMGHLERPKPGMYCAVKAVTA